MSYNNELLNILVGAANGGKSSVNGTQTPDGATGGTGAHAYTYLSASGGSGTDATDGNPSTTFLYPPTSVGGAGGGGACFSENRNGDSTGGTQGKGGAPGGGAGHDGRSNGIFGSGAGEDGSSYGSGGGGGYAFQSQNDETSTPNFFTPGGSGKQGVVGFVWRYKS